MHVRRGILTAALVLALAGVAGCGGDDKPEAEPTFGMTEVAVECDAFAETAKKITDAQAELYTASGGQEAVDALLGELDALRDGAPKEVQAALDDLGEAFVEARELLEKPTAEAAAKLAEITKELSEQGQKITEYVKGECG